MSLTKRYYIHFNFKDVLWFSFYFWACWKAKQNTSQTNKRMKNKNRKRNYIKRTILQQQYIGLCKWKCFVRREFRSL